MNDMVRATQAPTRQAPATEEFLLAAQAHANSLEQSLASVLRGRPDAIRRLVVAFAAGGHVLLEDVPGTGKTTLAKALARSIDAQFQRIQFTPDLLPADIVGVSIYSPKDQSFSFNPGPVFTQVLLADEVNRASPRTQSALLEAMGERQVSLDGVQRRLDPLFFVVATQNPIDFEGTYPLPEAQMDRFAMRFALGYLDEIGELDVLNAHGQEDPLDRLRPVLTVPQALTLREAVRNVTVSDELRRYIVALIAATRGADGIKLGASARASIALMQLSQALALCDGRSYVLPEDIQWLAVSVIAHRLYLEASGQHLDDPAEQVVRGLLKTVPVPT